MNLYNNIEQNSLLIVPENIRLSILKNINKLVNYKFMTKEEFVNKMSFDYGVEAVDYLIENYNYTVENSYNIIINHILPKLKL